MADASVSASSASWMRFSPAASSACAQVVMAAIVPVTAAALSTAGFTPEPSTGAPATLTSVRKYACSSSRVRTGGSTTESARKENANRSRSGRMASRCLRTSSP